MIEILKYANYIRSKVRSDCQVDFRSYKKHQLSVHISVYTDEGIISSQKSLSWTELQQNKLGCSLAVESLIDEINCVIGKNK